MFMWRATYKVRGAIVSIDFNSPGSLPFERQVYDAAIETIAQREQVDPMSVLIEEIEAVDIVRVLAKTE